MKVFQPSVQRGLNVLIPLISVIETLFLYFLRAIRAAAFDVLNLRFCRDCPKIQTVLTEVRLSLARSPTMMKKIIKSGGYIKLERIYYVPVHLECYQHCHQTKPANRPPFPVSTRSTYP